MIGTNAWDIIGDIGKTAYIARVQALIAAALALHERVHVMYYTLLPQNEANAGREIWQSWRATINSAMTAWAGAQDRVHVADVGGSATIGSRALQDSGSGGPYYLSDEIHLSTVPKTEATSGDYEFAIVSRAATQAWRTALAID